MRIAIVLAALVALIALAVFIRRKKKSDVIYFDNNATMPMSESVAETLKQAALHGGNPSASYNSCARCVLQHFRDAIRREAHAPGYAVIFTSGASESNNLVIRGTVDQYWLAKGSIPHVIISAIEHKTSILCIKQLAKLGRAEYDHLPVDQVGRMDPAALERLIRPNTTLISLMHVNNETGVTNDINKLAAVANKYGIPFHTDLAQSFGRIPVNLAGISAASISFHKFGGPPGCGALLLAPGFSIQPQISGTQNEGMRGGTENLPGLIASAAALRESQQPGLREHTRALRAMLRDGIAARVPEAVFLDNGIGNVICVSFPVCGNVLRAQLNIRGIKVSTGSACNSMGSAQNSHVLEAMGVPAHIRHGVIRISLSYRNTVDEVKRFLDVINEAIENCPQMDDCCGTGAKSVY